MLRGQVPTDRSPQEIVFDKLEDVDDVWTQLFYAMLGKDYGELWYWGGKRNKEFAKNFVERWVPSFDTYKAGFMPDVIFCRGGFLEYHSVLKRFPNAIKIYYGAGRRFLPQHGFYDYDIILQDSPEQVRECREKFPKALVTLFIKPAADNIFYPMPHIKKEYDVCFPANAAQAFKGHKFVYDTVPSDIKLLNLGNRCDRYKYPSNVTSYKVLRPKMAENIAKCKVGIVAVQSEIDSCPRVIPEMLACDIPIVVLERVKFWRDKYIVTSVTGELTTLNKFWDKVKHVLNNVEKYSPRKYYEENLSLEHAARFIKEKINGVKI
jgi:hypothetical protein